MIETGRLWERTSVTSPGRESPIPVVVARHVPYVADANRMQTLTIYLPATSENEGLIGQAVDTLPGVATKGSAPRYQVHVHGGAWRDPMLDARSIESAAAYAFDTAHGAVPLLAIASLDYTLTQFPNHPSVPYDAERDGHSDPAREAVHPDHVHDVYRGLKLLGSLGLKDGDFLLTGHSVGGAILFQACLEAPSYWGLEEADDAPVPAAAVGLNGLYDLPALVYGLGPSHEINAHDYRAMLNNAYGADEQIWHRSSPAHLNAGRLAERVAAGRAPRLVWIDQSPDDQLVPVNQRDRLATNLGKVEGLRLVVAERLTGRHAEPWQKGEMIWLSVKDVLEALRS